MLFDGMYRAIDEIKREIKEAIANSGTLERRHNAEISRVLDQHSRETAALQQQIASLTDLNERLLRQCGLDPITSTSTSQEVATVQQNSAPSPEPVTNGARLIKRDKERVYGLVPEPNTPEYRAYLERMASEIVQQRSKASSE